MANKTTTTKMTKAQKFNTLLTIPAVKENAMLVEFIEHELELLNKKNSAEKKPTAQQTANASIQEAVVAHLSAEPTRLFTITELCKEVPGLPENMTNQRMSAIVRQLVGVSVERIEEKRKAYFRYLSE